MLGCPVQNSVCLPHPIVQNELLPVTCPQLGLLCIFDDESDCGIARGVEIRDFLQYRIMKSMPCGSMAMHVEVRLYVCMSGLTPHCCLPPKPKCTMAAPGWAIYTVGPSCWCSVLDWPMSYALILPISKSDWAVDMKWHCAYRKCHECKQQRSAPPTYDTCDKALSCNSRIRTILHDSVVSKHHAHRYVWCDLKNGQIHLQDSGFDMHKLVQSITEA